MEYDTREKIEPLGILDPEIAAFLAGRPAASLGAEDDEVQKMMEKAKAEQTSRPDSSTEYSIHIPMRDGYQSETRIHKPESPSGDKHPLIVLIYGGGFVMGHCTQLSPYARIAAKVFNAVVVNISYRLAPVHKFPAAPNDAWDSLKWIAANAHTLGADPYAGFILGGASAGGNLAAVVAQKSVDEGLTPPLTGTWLCIPYLLEEEIVPPKYKDVWFSREQNAAGPVIDKDGMAHMKAAYGADVKSPDLSPFNSKNPHKGLPPTFLQVCGTDPLRDDGLVYDRVLREHGVKTKLVVYPGAPHGHIMFPSKLSTKSHFDTFDGLAWLLGKETPDEEVITQELALNPIMSV
ncbi:alpha beta hydrolase fold-3 domain-containing protein [Colletotrichum karsti]|uniref:Alpha beta hydrolase fold-3 domain-containing protein n=1 Tax=Colletotrichum karsti TaxID=1095194 RepID=A0A9P6HUI6_9PEZI|nr:alpha beta hydrolase fold-3 domain-containing protein [Colletotrichum karsti]KAF9871463.1 alpha beta hydrolase fold-3 domain-containing protein [Colletotrichum karsti]